MRFVMTGAGAVGGYFGARLAAAGNDVTFIARGTHLEAMRTRGLAVESPLGDIRLGTVTAVPDAAGLVPADVVFIAVKLPDTAAAIEAAAPAVGPDTLVISLQNGLAGEDFLEAAFGPERVAGGVVYIASVVAAPGLIRHTGTNQRIVVGERGGAVSPRITALVRVLKDAGIDAEASPDILHAMWEKFIFLVGLSAATSLTGETIGVIRADPDMRALLGAVMAETAAVARARGLAFDEGYVEDRLRFADTLPEGMRSSMYHDLAAGKPLELEWLSGAVVSMGRDAGVPTPANATVYAALKPRAGGAPCAPGG